MPAARSNSGDDSARSPVLVTGTSDQPNFRLGDSAYNNGASGYNSLQVSLNHKFASNFRPG